MNTKLIFAALAMTFGVSFVSHADEYRRPRPVPQQQERYDEEDLDDDYRRPAPEECDPCGRRERPRIEYYCSPDRCGHAQPPEVLPYPVQQQPVFVPVPMPRVPYVGPCSVQPRNWGGGNIGWVFVNAAGIEVARGSRAQAPWLPQIKINLIQTGVCLPF